MPDNQRKRNINISPISWTAPEFIRYEKTKNWFIGLFAIGGALIIISLFMRNFLFAFIILMATFLIYVQAQRRPKKIKFEISSEGILIDDKKYSYSELRSFWIFEEPELKCLSLISRRITQPQIQIPLAEQDSSAIKEILKNFLPEIKQEESAIDTIARKLKY